MFTDSKRLQQIIKNLLSNAFKFTHHGQVTLTIETAQSGWNITNDDLNRTPLVLAFGVSDTGIGIPSDKQQIIFEAFQQADGSTSRKYGGTGLGLAISRELSRLLGGEIRLVSSPDHGSVFTLYLPAVYTPRSGRKVALSDNPPAGLINRVFPASEKSARSAADGVARSNGAPPALNGQRDDLLEPLATHIVNEVGDDRDDIQPGDRVLLIVENDLAFARFLLDTAREKGFKGLVTSLGANALEMTREFKPDAITLDIYLPDIEGWRVLERLKNDLGTRHTAVCVISTDEARERALSSGALAFVAKPIQSRDVLDSLLDTIGDFIGRSMMSLLVVEPDQQERNRIVECVGADDVQVTAVADAESALQMLRERRIDCMILNPEQTSLVDGISLADGRRENGLSRLPVIVYGNGEPVEGVSWKRLAESCTVRRAHSKERLLDLSAFFLHRNIAKLHENKRQMLNDLHQADKLLAGKKVLIVDDDMRNIFALSTVLEEHEMVIVSADNGHDAITILQNYSDVDIVLMDIMMPEMDGMETMREIRKVPRLKNLPIVAVTAKAMKGDREKCIEAGAWDYLSKPVDTEQMLAVLRAWLHR
jgi:CheY-like chemotaxis protein